MHESKEHFFSDALKNGRIQPKLRMILNGSAKVNTYRSERCASIAVTDPKLLQYKILREPGNLPTQKSRGRKEDVSRKPHGILATLFIRLIDVNTLVPFQVEPYCLSRNRDILVAEVPLDLIPILGENADIAEISLGDNVVFNPPYDLKVLRDGSADPTLKTQRKLNHLEDKHRQGEGVMVGIIDVQGFDFSHSDFLDSAGKTRFAAIWDQGGITRQPPGDFGYGAEILQDHINQALLAAPELGLRATELEPQSQMARSSHATHVASIAAGNSGVASRSTLVGVSISLATEDLDRRKNFFDSTRLAHAIDYILSWSHKGNEGSGMPVVINISLGTNGHAHDGTNAICRLIDSNFTRSGRCVCVAAGNAGQESPAKPGDLGFLGGRIHTSGVLRAAGLTRHIEWIVAGGGIADLSENELEIWYSMQDKFAISIRPPDGHEWIGPVNPGQFIENKQLDNGTFVSIYNERYAPANGENYISCFLSPPLTELGTGGVTSGIWTIRLHALEVRNGAYHGWIERDDPRKFGRLGVQEGWAFPSFFSRNSNIDDSSVTSLGCGRTVLTVGSLDDFNERVHYTSSQGPSRDGRQKPEILAPGVDIIAANGFDLPERKWVHMTGSSMASPYVAGVAALMLAVQPDLTSAQIAGIMRRTARPLPGYDYNWKNDAGFGSINPQACVSEAEGMNIREDISHQ